ncbi:ABC transporter ATPase [Psychrobacillus psychrotolerans]|uniref:ABC transporter ATPase n=1 Tax=Psychrobacillus psychrotolerans TaxID=126156 RepID=UPI003989D909
MACKLSEQDFEVLKEPLKSGRQSPGSIAGALFLTIFLQGILFSLEYFFVGVNTTYPYKDEILSVHLWITGVLILFSLLYSIPAIYKRSDKMQYFISILVSQNLFSVSFLICALFLIGNDDGSGTKESSESLLNFTYVTLGIGLLVFVLTCIRFYILLQRGEYRKGSKKEELRGRFEVKSYIPVATVAGTGLVFVIQYIARISTLNDLNMIIFIVIGIGLFFTMVFVLPEQLVILYCKIRFQSFNFNERGYLK